MAYPNLYIQELIRCVSTAFIFGKKNANETYTPFIEKMANNKDQWISDLWKKYDGGTNRGAYCIVGATVMLDEVFKIMAEKGWNCENPLPRFAVANGTTSLYGNVAAILGQTIQRGIVEIGTQPEPGSVFFRPSSGGNNHAGIVVDITDTGEMITIEANAAQDGVPIAYGFSENRYDATQYAAFDKGTFKEPPASLIPYSYPQPYKTLRQLLTDVTGKPDGWQFAYISRMDCAAQATTSILVPSRIVALGVEVVCEPAETPKKDKKTVSPCADAPRPTGDGWEKTPDTSTASDTGEYEYSEDYCWRRQIITTVKKGTLDCDEQAPAGEGWVFLGKNRETEDGYEYSPRLCWRRPKFVNTKECPTQIDRSTCLPSVSVKAARFSGSLVPHYSWLRGNRYAAADITGAMDYLNKKPEMIGVALDNAGLGYDTVKKEIIPPMVSRFTTVRDDKGRLYYIVPEWSGSRMNSLFGMEDKNDVFPGLLPTTKVFVVLTEALTGGGSGKRSEADALFIAGIPEHYDGFPPYRAHTLMNAEAFAKAFNVTLNGSSGGNTGTFGAVDFVAALKDKAVSTIEKLKRRGNRSIQFLTHETIGATTAVNLVGDNPQSGIINFIEASNLPVDIPIVVIMMTATEPPSLFDTLKVFLSVIASAAAVVGIPPQIFQSALAATETLETLTSGNGSINDIVRLAGAVTALLPESVRGEIESLVKDIQGVDGVRDIIGLGEDAAKFLEKQGKELDQIFTKGVGFARSIKDSKYYGSAAKLFGIDPVGNFTTQLAKEFFGGKDINLKNFSPSWFEQAKNYANTIGGNYDAGFRQGVKILHNIETLKASDQFARYANSGQMSQDIITEGTALTNEKVQNLLIAGAAGSVMSAMPKIGSIADAIINQTNDIQTIDELSALTVIGTGFRQNGAAFERLTLQAIAHRLDGLRDKVTEFVLPPSLSTRQQECWTKELAECFGITIIPSVPDVQVYEVKKKTVVPVEGKTNPGGGIIVANPAVPDVPVTPDKPVDKATEGKPVVRDVPPCIREIDMSWYYCPPPTCAIDVLTAATAATNVGMSGLDIGQILNSITQNPTLPGMVEQSPLTRPTASTITFTAPAAPVQMTELAPAVVPPVATPATNKDCGTKYPARTDAAGNWYALIKGKFIQIIDCCIPSQSAECCDKTLQEFAALKTGMLKLQELVMRRSDGDTSAPCDIEPLRNDIAALAKRIDGIKFPDNTVITDGLRKDIDGLRQLITGIKSYDNRSELAEIKELVRAIKSTDNSAIAKEVKDLREFLNVARTEDKAFFIQRFDTLEKLVRERQQIAQKDYSADLQEVTGKVDVLGKNLAYLQEAIANEVNRKTYELPTQPTVQAEIDELVELKKEQEEIYARKIDDAKQAAANLPPCDECGKLSEILTELRMMKQTAKAQPATATAKPETATPKTTTTTTERRTNGDCPDCPKMIVYDYPEAPMSFGGTQQLQQPHDCDCNCEDNDCPCDC